MKRDADGCLHLEQLPYCVWRVAFFFFLGEVVVRCQVRKGHILKEKKTGY